MTKPTETRQIIVTVATTDPDKAFQLIEAALSAYCLRQESQVVAAGVERIHVGTPDGLQAVELFNILG